MKGFVLAGLLVMSVQSVFADDTQIKNKLTPFGVTNMKISDSPIAGLKTIVSDQGIFYASENGDYFLQGSLVKITPSGAVDLSNEPLMDKLNRLSQEMIVYPAKNEKYQVTVFTDITCPYCMKLHNHISDYNDLGITVRYLAFPRAGLHSDIAGKMETIWQSDDPKAAFSAAEKGNIPKTETPLKIIPKQYNLGIQFGVNGTPAIVLNNGAVLPGYVEPARLLQALQQN